MQASMIVTRVAYILQSRAVGHAVCDAMISLQFAARQQFIQKLHFFQTAFPATEGP
jgi:hypothetical protein